MIPTFLEMITELNEDLEILIYESTHADEWEVKLNHKFLFKVNALDPSDEFLH